MLSIKPSNTPAYLHDSAFFANLTEDDEEVSVPKDCCKLDTSVTNSAELEELLRTLRFWGVDQIPESVLQFVIKNSLEEWEPVCNEYAKDFVQIAQLLKIMRCEREHRVCEATELGNVGLVSYLLGQDFPTEYKHSFYYTTKCSRAVDIAARLGNLEILQELHRHNCSFQESTGRAAALGGHAIVLQYVIQHGCLVCESFITYAFAGGNLTCLQYVHEALGCQWLSNIFADMNYIYALDKQQNSGVAVTQRDEHRLLECLQYAQAHVKPDFSFTSANVVCAKRNWLTLLQFLHEHSMGGSFSHDVVTAAALSGSLGCLQYALEHGCTVPDNLMLEAFQSGSTEVVQYLYDRGVPWPTRALFTRHGDVAAAAKAVVCISYAYKLGCPRDPNTCLYACMNGWYDLLVDAHQHGCKWGTLSARYAAEGGHLNCLKYLHENGCPWDENTTTYALQQGRYDCFKYAMENGCPIGHF